MKTCLVVDDSNVVRKVALRILENLELEPSEAEHGQAALEACQQEMPDAILLDCYLPAMPSTEFIGSVRALANGKKPFILYCATENDSSEIARALTAGADDYVMKPYTRETIKAKFGPAGVV